MGFLSKAFRDQIMSPIGRPVSAMGVRPILREPGLDIPSERNIFEQPNPFLPPQTPITPPVNITDPVLPRMKPPIIPPKPPSIGGIGGINQDFRPLQKPIIPPSRDDFMSIERIGEPKDEFIPRMPNENPISFVPPVAPAPIDLPAPILPDPRAIRPPMPISIGRPPSIGRPIRPPIPPSIGKMPPPGMVVPGGGGIDYGGGEGPPLLPIQPPADDRIRPLPVGPGIPFDPTKPLGPGDLGYIDTGSLLPKLPGGGITPPGLYDSIGMPLIDPINPLGSTTTQARSPVQYNANPAPTPSPIVTPEPVIQPTVTDPTMSTEPVTTPTDPTQTQMPMGAIDPVLLQQSASEVQTDPLLRSLYFGTADSPGFYNQLQQAGANLIGSDVPLQQTAGLTPLELLARQQAVAGLGGFEPFLQQNRNLVNQAIQQSRRAEQLQDPYYTQAEDIYKDTMGAYDPSMTQQFYNPFEDAVVQQTIEDVMKAGEQQDIAARAREISSGAFGGSRARLGAEERRQDLGEGLAKALGGIRSQGFQSAQATGLGEFARQQQAKRTGAQGLMGIGVGRGSAASNLGQQLAGFGGQLTGLGRTQEELRRGQRGELSGYGTTGRGIAETGLGRIYEQQMGQQLRPLGVLGQIGSMLPGYQGSRTQIDSQYGMPTDPSAAGLGAAFSAYGAMAPKGSS